MTLPSSETPVSEANSPSPIISNWHNRTFSFCSAMTEPHPRGHNRACGSFSFFTDVPVFVSEQYVVGNLWKGSFISCPYMYVEFR
jgi:hypothetical protein